MPTDYEKVYREQRHALGEPSKEFVRFFEQVPTPSRVLDVGCGQGRDALFIARLGHRVVGIDLSASGISQLQADAKREKLDITGIVANIVEFTPIELFDILLFDRTLHMLPSDDQLNVLRRYIKLVDKNGFVLINDERKNLPAMEACFRDSASTWITRMKKKGFLYLQRAN